MSLVIYAKHRLDPYSSWLLHGWHRVYVTPLADQWPRPDSGRERAVTGGTPSSHPAPPHAGGAGKNAADNQ